MIIPRTVSPQMTIDLLDELEEKDLPVPAEAQHGRNLLAALDQASTRDNDPDDILALTTDEIVALAERDGVMVANEQAVRGSAGIFRGRVVTAIRDVMRSNIDPILDVLRPAFDAAGVAVHQAVQAGIVPGMRAEQVILVSDEAVLAWRDLPTHLNVLEDIALLRVQLVDVFDTEPLIANTSRETLRPYGLCFTTGRAWETPGETSWDRWLRLCASTPATLMSTTDTALNAQAFRRQQLDTLLS